MGRGRSTSSSSGCSSIGSSSSSNINNPVSHSKQLLQLKRDLSTDLRLGLSLSISSPCTSASQQHNPSLALARRRSSDWRYSTKQPLNPEEEEEEEAIIMNNNYYGAAEAEAEAEAEADDETSTSSTLYVKVYMEGHAIGRKLDLLAHHAFQDLIRTLEHMFNTNILWGDEVDRVQLHFAANDLHVLTYEDEEGDWLIVGDVPWEMFLSAAKRLKITRTFPC